MSFADMVLPSELAGNLWCDAIPQRNREVLIYHMRTADASSISVDTSQQINRASRGTASLTQTLTPKMVTWMMPRSTGDGKEVGNRLLLGYEALALQGFPMEWVDSSKDDCQDGLMKDIAGNAFSSSVFAAVYISLLSLLPDKVIADDSSTAMEDVLELMKQAA